MISLFPKFQSFLLALSLIFNYLKPLITTNLLANPDGFSFYDFHFIGHLYLIDFATNLLCF